MTPSQVLLAAADLLERDGWCQGTLRDGIGRHCTNGAINAVTLVYMGDPFSGAWKLLYSLLDRTSVTAWNDAPWQTAENVIATLRKAAQ
jgi:hypothetical protein